MNEMTWRHVLAWEQMHCAECSSPKLLRFLGRPHELRCCPHAAALHRWLSWIRAAHMHPRSWDAARPSVPAGSMVSLCVLLSCHESEWCTCAHAHGMQQGLQYQLAAWSLHGELVVYCWLAWVRATHMPSCLWDAAVNTGWQCRELAGLT